MFAIYNNKLKVYIHGFLVLDQGSIRYIKFSSNNSYFLHWNNQPLLWLSKLGLTKLVQVFEFCNINLALLFHCLLSLY